MSEYPPNVMYADECPPELIERANDQLAAMFGQVDGSSHVELVFDSAPFGAWRHTATFTPGGGRAEMRQETTRRDMGDCGGYIEIPSVVEWVCEFPDEPLALRCIEPLDIRDPTEQEKDAYVLGEMRARRELTHEAEQSHRMDMIETLGGRP